MLEEIEGIYETVEANATCTEDAKDLQTLPEEGTSYFPMLDIASNQSSQAFEARVYKY